MLYQAIPDIEQNEEVLNEPVSLKAQVVRRVPIFIAVLLFVAVAIRGTHPPKSSTSPAAAASFSEFESDCLSRDYGPVKEGFDLVSASAVDVISASFLYLYRRAAASRVSRFRMSQVSYQSIQPGPGSPGVKGTPDFNSVYQGYTLWFSSGVNKEVFDANPIKYMPMVSGHRQPPPLARCVFGRTLALSTSLSLLTCVLSS